MATEALTLAPRPQIRPRRGHDLGCRDQYLNEAAVAGVDLGCCDHDRRGNDLTSPATADNAAAAAVVAHDLC